MLIGDKIVYFELHKTGCSFVRRVLTQFNELGVKKFGKHNSFKELPKEIVGGFDHILKVGNIRNPWDWYVSLWAFGCQQKGGIYDRTTSRAKIKSLYGLKRVLKRPSVLFQKTDLWARLYSDVSNISHFQEWVREVIQNRQYDLGENYSAHKISNQIGLLTHRYLRLYTRNYYDVIDQLKGYDSVKEFDRESMFIDRMFKMEDLNKDVRELLNDLGVEVVRVEEVMEKYNYKVNRSVREDYRKYYNDETKELVESKEKLIIQKYKYAY